MLKRVRQLTPFQMFAISALLLAFDFMLVMSFFGPVDSAVQKSHENWDFRIAELRQVDAEESDTEVAGVSVVREKAESQPTPEPTQQPQESSTEDSTVIESDRGGSQSFEGDFDDFGFNIFLDNEEVENSPVPFWPAYYQFR